jgi:hypothetical protein
MRLDCIEPAQEQPELTFDLGLVDEEPAVRRDGDVRDSRDLGRRFDAEPYDRLRRVDTPDLGIKPQAASAPPIAAAAAMPLMRIQDRGSD